MLLGDKPEFIELVFADPVSVSPCNVGGFFGVDPGSVGGIPISDAHPFQQLNVVYSIDLASFAENDHRRVVLQVAIGVNEKGSPLKGASLLDLGQGGSSI